jgi:hypothetical protein
VRQAIAALVFSFWYGWHKKEKYQSGDASPQ